MKRKSSNQKTAQPKQQDLKQTPACGPDCAAIAPPAYGIRSLDQGSAHTTSDSAIQRKHDSNAGPGPANRTGLPDGLKTGIESLSGLAMDDVRVHYNSSKPAALQALAYTQGTDIHVAPGQERHLPHEAWHVVQQAQGRVQPTMQMKGGVPVNDSVGLESEADAMGARAFQRKASSHTNGCGCSSCAPGMAAEVQSGRTQGIKEVAQLKCEICQSEDHTWKKCPDNPDNDPEPEVEEATSSSSAAVAEKVPGWKKQGGGPTGNYKNTTGHHDPTLAKWRKKSVKKKYLGKRGATIM